MSSGLSKQVIFEKTPSRQVFSQNAFLLHSRKYTDSRILIDLFCEQKGRVSGALRLSSGKNKARSPQAFCELEVDWKGKTDLKNIVNLESKGSHIPLQGVSMYCGLYLNELLIRLLAKEDPHIEIYQAYSHTLSLLHDSELREVALRQFELKLLTALGYGIDFTADVTGEKISANKEDLYAYIIDRGFEPVPGNMNAGKNCFDGFTLKQIANGDFSCERVKIQAKLLCRENLARLLGDKPLKSRELFSSE